LADRLAPTEPPSEGAAYELLERLRWDGAPPTCPHCGTAGRSRYLSPRSGTERSTRTGAASERRVWKCSACGRQFSALVGTVLQGTRLDVRTWIAVIRKRESSGRAPSATELVRDHGVSREGAAQVIRRLELALRAVRAAGGEELLSAVLQLHVDDAARIRHATPPRVRPRPQAGPSADYGRDA
jgi:transposase-like protein